MNWRSVPRWTSALKRALRLRVQRLVAGDVARLEQRGAHGHVGLGLADHLVERAGGMADLQPEVPERVEHRFDDLLAPAGLLAGHDEADVDVGMRRHLAAAIAADREQQQPLAGGRVGARVEPLDGEGEQRLQHRVGQVGAGVGRLQPARGMDREAARDLGAAGRRAPS